MVGLGREATEVQCHLQGRAQGAGRHTPGHCRRGCGPLVGVSVRSPVATLLPRPWEEVAVCSPHLRRARRAPSLRGQSIHRKSVRGICLFSPICVGKRLFKEDFVSRCSVPYRWGHLTTV